MMRRSTTTKFCKSPQYEARNPTLASAQQGKGLPLHNLACTWTSKLPKIMDPTLPTVFLLGHWAVVLSTLDVQVG